MKVGAENRKKLYAMVGLAALALLLVLRAFLSFGGPVAASIPDAPGSRGKTSAPPLDPALRTEMLKNSEEAEYKGTGRNIFDSQAPLPPLPHVSRNVVKAEIPLPPPPPPPPPPIPLKFYGFANKPGQAKSIFLAQGEDIFIGREGDIINRRYKIIRIQQNQVEIEDVLNNNRQAIPLTQG
jgi:hypothetical protein